MTPQSRRKATPDEDVDVECIPETEIKGGSDMMSADVASIRQPFFGAASAFAWHQSSCASCQNVYCPMD